MEPTLRVKEDLTTQGRAWAGHDEGTLLAAALAAVLVDYRRQLGPHTDQPGSEGPGLNWRIMGRWQQLRG